MTDNDIMWQAEKSMEQQLREAEALRGYRLVSMRPFARSCLSCGQNVAEGAWCCIGWWHHLHNKHGVFAASFKDLKAAIEKYSDDGESCTACTAAARRKNERCPSCRVAEGDIHLSGCAFLWKHYEDALHQKVALEKIWPSGNTSVNTAVCTPSGRLTGDAADGGVRKAMGPIGGVCKNCTLPIHIDPSGNPSVAHGWVHDLKIWGSENIMHTNFNNGVYCTIDRRKFASPMDPIKAIEYKYDKATRSIKKKV